MSAELARGLRDVAARLEAIAQQLEAPAVVLGDGPFPPPRGLVDAAGAAQLLSVKLSTVRGLTRAGRLPSIKLGRLVRYDPAELLAWAKEHGRG